LVKSQYIRTDDVTHWLGVDVGGTFTDLILVGPNHAHFEVKVPSTPPDFERGILAGLDEILARSGVGAEQLAAVVHGTTIATNAILERRGATTAMIATKGFKDVLELGRLRHPSLYDTFWQKPDTLVPRARCFEIDERRTSDGEVLQTVKEAEVTDVVAMLTREGVESVAVCLLNSYVNSDHETRIAQQIRERLPDLYVTCSAELVPEIKEYERWSTAVVNAYVQPLVDGYVAGLEKEMTDRGLSGDFFIMQSSGGLLDSGTARTRPVQLIESGPAAGVIAARHLTVAAGLEDSIAFDMGGTTAKASLIEKGKTFETPEYEVGGGMNNRRGLLSGAGYAVRMTSIDIAEIGAGGGSIVWVDKGNVPHVGPHSAGAHPGPACYGHGGTRATVTDADVVLGYFSSDSLAGGAQKIDRALAEAAIRDELAPLGLSPLEAAFGVHTIVSAGMTRAIKAVTTERGRDPRAYALIAFGGAGPAHAATIAAELGIKRVIVPPSPGLFSTAGLLVSNVHMDFVTSYRGGDVLDLTAINAAFNDLGRRASAALTEDRGSTLQLARSADVRYVGQSADLRVEVSGLPIDDTELGAIRERFDGQHLRTYGHSSQEQRIEIVNLRVRVTRVSDHKVYTFGLSNGSRDARRVQDRTAYFGPEIGTLQVPVIGRGELSSTATSGPLIIEDMDSTTIVPPKATAVRDSLGNVVLTV